jgi:hypothetical protein
LLIDNAPYHTSNASLQMMEALQLPIMFTGAHSYSSSPVELLFSRLKATNINEKNLPMGKS